VSTVEPTLRSALDGIPAYKAGKPPVVVPGVTSYKLASNENCLGSSPLAVAAAKAALDKTHLYPDAGAFALKARIARFHDVDAKHIVVGAGSN
jgi:histidinol-phosphate aminotransferase